jgi:hypothetical protein
MSKNLGSNETEKEVSNGSEKLLVSTPDVPPEKAEEINPSPEDQEGKTLPIFSVPAPTPEITYPQIGRSKGRRKAKTEGVVAAPKFDTSNFNKSHIKTFLSIYAKGQNRGEIKWSTVQSLMENGFNGKMYGTKGGAGRQFDLFLLEKPDELIRFVTLDDYNNYLKQSKKNSKLNYKITRRAIHTERPHSRGASKKGKTRFLYPALIELLAVSLKNAGFTPQSLGWE